MIVFSYLDEVPRSLINFDKLTIIPQNVLVMKSDLSKSFNRRYLVLGDYIKTIHWMLRVLDLQLSSILVKNWGCKLNIIQ